VVFQCQLDNAQLYSQTLSTSIYTQNVYMYVECEIVKTGELKHSSFSNDKQTIIKGQSVIGWLCLLCIYINFCFKTRTASSLRAMVLL
jgi:hypothetical protein